ncbi:MAG: IPT/TIG domain-containing protein [Nitrospirota bacterium]
MRSKIKGIFIFGLLVLIFLISKNPSFSKTETSDIPLELNPRGVAINPFTDIAVVANKKSDSVSIVDLVTQKVLSTIPVGNSPKGVAIDSEFNIALVSNNRDNTVSIINLDTHQIVTSLPVGKSPGSIVVNPLNHTALVANHRDDTVSIIDLITYKVIEKIGAGRGPQDLAVDPILNIALVVNKSDCGVSIIDLKEYRITGTIPVGMKPRSVDINPENHVAVVANEKDNSITIVNLQTWQISNIPVGRHPKEVTINPLDNRTLVICNKTLLLIDLDTRKIIKSYSLNNKLRGVAVNKFTNIAAITDDKNDCLTLIQLPNPIPELSLLNPSIIQRGSNGESISIEGNKFMKTSKAYFGDQPAETTFIDNRHLVIKIPENQLLKAGIFQITLVNPPPEGGTSNPLYLGVENPVPSISVLNPAEAMTGTPTLNINIHGTGFFEDTEVYFGGIKKPVSYVNGTKMQIELSSEDLKMPGSYEIIAYNQPPAGGYSNKVTFTIKTTFEIIVTSPLSGETINKAKTVVNGTIRSGTSEISIKVNGILAEIRGNEWIANDVPLTIGTNTITVVATDLSGNTDTKTITVYTSDTTQPVELSANITSGSAPLQVFFSISTNFSPVSYQMDFEGDGVVDYTGPTFEDINFTYTSEGIFYPTVTVKDNQENSYSDKIAIIVLSKTEMDILLREKWDGMKKGMADKDIQKAVSYFAEWTKERYSAIFAALGDRLPQIAQDMQNIKMIYVRDGVAKYRIRRIEAEGEITYYIYFVRDENGFWKIQQF